MLCILMDSLSLASAKKRAKRLKGFKFALYWSFLSDIMAVKGLKRQSEVKGLKRQSEVKGLKRQSEVKGLKRQSEVKGLKRQSELHPMSDTVLRREE